MAPGLLNAAQAIARLASGAHAAVRCLTAADLWANACALTERLRESKVQTWVLASRNPWDVLVGCLAAWTVPERTLQVALPPNLLPATLQNLVARLDSPGGPAAVLTEALDFDSSVVSPLRARHWAACAVERLNQERSSRRHCLTLFTSGTTGEAQSHGKTLQQLWLEAELQASLFFQAPMSAARERCVLSCVPPHHIFGLLFGVWVPFAAGVSFVATDAPPTVPALGADVTDVVSVPAQLGAWVGTWDPAGTAPARPERVFCSGGPLPAAWGAQLLAHGIELVELFGSTETGGIARRVNDPGGLWRPLPDLNVSEGPEQRLLLDSPLHGADSPVLTQDRIRIEPGGFVHLGRNDDVVKVGAKRVALSDLEHFVRSLPHVSDVAAIAVADPGLREQALWLAVASAPTADRLELEAQLRASLRQHFDAVIVPRRIRVVDHLPRNAVGKLPREALLALFDAPLVSGVELPQSAGETKHGARS